MVSNKTVSTLTLLFFIATASSQEDPNPLRFIDDPMGGMVSIDLFRQWDKKNATVDNSIVFVGSSSIRGWPTAEYFPDLPIINRGFGGSHISDINYFINETVLKYSPKLIVFYAGENDIYFRKTSQIILEDFISFTNQVNSQLPNTKIIFISIKPSPKRWVLWNEMKKANQLIHNYSKKNPGLYYVNIASLMLNNKELPKHSLFLSDKLHMNNKGYDLWSEVLEPLLRDLFESD